MKSLKDFFKNMKVRFSKLFAKKQKAQKNQGTEIKSKRKKTSSSKSIDFSTIFNAIFAPESRGFIHRTFIISFAAFFMYFAGKNLGLFLMDKFGTAEVKPKKVATRLRKRNQVIDFKDITKKDLFATKQLTPVKRPGNQSKEPEKEKKCNEEEADKSSQLPIKLIGTIILQDEVKSVASVQVRNKKPLLSIRQGEKIDNMAEIKKINEFKVIFKNLKTGTCEFVENKQKKARGKPIRIERNPVRAKALIAKMDDRISVEGNKYKIKKSLVTEALTDITSLLTKAKAIQITNPDGSLCFKMTQVEAGSLYTQLNIQNDDIICSIDGKKINGLNDVMSMFGRIKDIDQLELSVKRDGAEQELQYNFE